eukprot:GDKH01004454.1.p1 GENE.GDKH01004454.1~~GDKH01004454.1.p1  ORF type:complete len:270 (-),score=29.52 GDKH01004454.1:297-1106(-)
MAQGESDSKRPISWYLQQCTKFLQEHYLKYVSTGTVPGITIERLEHSVDAYINIYPDVLEALQSAPKISYSRTENLYYFDNPYVHVKSRELLEKEIAAHSEGLEVDEDLLQARPQEMEGWINYLLENGMVRAYRLKRTSKQCPSIAVDQEPCSLYGERCAVCKENRGLVLFAKASADIESHKPVSSDIIELWNSIKLPETEEELRRTLDLHHTKPVRSAAAAQATARRGKKAGKQHRSQRIFNRHVFDNDQQLQRTIDKYDPENQDNDE